MLIHCFSVSSVDLIPRCLHELQFLVSFRRTLLLHCQTFESREDKLFCASGWDYSEQRDHTPIRLLRPSAKIHSDLFFFVARALRWSCMVRDDRDVGMQRVDTAISLATTSPTRKKEFRWKVLTEDKTDPPVHTEFTLEVPTAVIFVNGANAVSSCVLRPPVTWNMAVPPDDTTSAHTSLRMSTSHCMTYWKEKVVQ